MDFITTQVSKVLENAGVKALADITVTAYGNAKTAGDTVTCQHGDNECVGST